MDDFGYVGYFFCQNFAVFNDYIFIFNEPSIANRKKLYIDYASNIPSFDHFNNILDSCTQNHECLVIDTTAKSSDLRDQIFWYKADMHDTFRVGHPKIWKYHEQHYNEKYQEEKHKDSIVADKLKKKFGKTNKLKIIVSRTDGGIVGAEETDED